MPVRGRIPDYMGRLFSEGTLLTGSSLAAANGEARLAAGQNNMRGRSLRSLPPNSERPPPGNFKDKGYKPKKGAKPLTAGEYTGGGPWKDLGFHRVGSRDGAGGEEAAWGGQRPQRKEEGRGQHWRPSIAGSNSGAAQTRPDPHPRCSGNWHQDDHGSSWQSRNAEQEAESASAAQTGWKDSWRQGAQEGDWQHNDWRTRRGQWGAEEHAEWSSDWSNWGQRSASAAAPAAQRPASSSSSTPYSWTSWAGPVSEVERPQSAGTGGGGYAQAWHNWHPDHTGSGDNAADEGAETGGTQRRSWQRE